MHSRGIRVSDPQRNVMRQRTEMSPLVSLPFRTFLNPLKFLMEIFNILVVLYTRACKCQLFTDEGSRRLPKRLINCFSVLASATNRSTLTTL